MREVYGDLWTYPARVRVLTTNGDVNKAGLAVMGRGVALQATQRWPHIRKEFANLLRVEGNHVFSLGIYGEDLKHHWHERADLQLIERSAREIANYAERVDCKDTIVIPRPGCGNGQLTWAEVKPVIEGILDDRFHVIDREEISPIAHRD